MDEYTLLNSKEYKRYIPRKGNETLYTLEDKIHATIEEVIDYRVETYAETRETAKLLTLLAVVEAYGEGYRVGGNLLLDSLVKHDFASSVAILKILNK